MPPPVFIVNNGPLFFALPTCDINVTSNGVYCNIVFIPTPQNYGESQVTISALHNSKTTSAFFTIRVGRVNQSPNFTIPFATVSVSADSGAWSVPNFVMNVPAGPFDTDQSTSFVVEAVNLTQASFAFSQLPRVSNIGVLTFLLKPNDYVYGKFSFSCALVDSPLSPLTSLNSTLYFTVSVAFVNQAPAFSCDSNISVNFTPNEMFAKYSFMKNVSAGPVSEIWQTVFCKLTPNADYSRSFIVSPFVVFTGSEGALFLQLAVGRSGTFFFILACKDDGGVANLGVDSAQPIVVSLTAPFINSPPSLDTVVQSINANSSTISSALSFQAVIIPAPVSFCVPYAVSTVFLNGNSSSVVDTSSYSVKPKAMFLPLDRLYSMRSFLSYQPSQPSTTNFEYFYVAEKFGGISVWLVANSSDSSSTATQMSVLRDGSITGILSDSFMQQSPTGMSGISSWTTNGLVYSFISGGCDDLKFRPGAAPVTSPLSLFTSWNFDSKYTSTDGSGTRLLYPSPGGSVASNGVILSECPGPAYYGSIPLMFCTISAVSGALQVVPDASSVNFPAYFSIEVNFSSASNGTQRVVVSATSPVISLQRRFYLAITALDRVEFGIVTEFFADSSGEYGRYAVLTSNQSITMNRSTHLVASYDGTSMFIFVNGVIAGSPTACSCSLLVVASSLPLQESQQFLFT